jgi:hypothetical protein
MRDLREQQEKAKEGQIDYGKELKKTVAAAGAFMSGPEVDKLVRGVALQAGADVNKANAAINAAFVAAGIQGLPKAEQKKAAEQAANMAGKVLELHKDEPAEDVGAIAGAAERIKRAAPKGTTDEQVLGSLELGKQMAGLEGEGALAKHFVPKTIAAMGKGETFGEAAALYATTAHLLGDSAGKLTDTATTDLLGEIHKHFPDAKDPAEILEKMMAGGAEGNRLTAQLYHKAVTSRGEVEAAHFGDKIDTAVEALIGDIQGKGRDPRAFAEYQQRKAALSNWKAGGDFYRNQVANLQKVGVIRTVEREELGAAAAKQNRLVDEQGAQIPLNEKLLEENLAASGADWAYRKAAMWRYAGRVRVGGEDPATVAEEILERRAQQLEATNQMGEGQRVPSEEDLAHAKNLHVLVKQLREKDREKQESREQEQPQSEGDVERQRQGTGQPRPVVEDGSREEHYLTREQLRSQLAAAGLPERRRRAMLETLFPGGIGLASHAQAEAAVWEEEDRLRTQREGRDARGNPALVKRVPGEALSTEDKEAADGLRALGIKLDRVAHGIEKMVGQNAKMVKQGEQPAEVVFVGRPQYETAPASASYSR